MKPAHIALMVAGGLGLVYVGTGIGFMHGAKTAENEAGASLAAAHHGYLKTIFGWPALVKLS